MKKTYSLLLLSIVSFTMNGCSKIYKTPELKQFEVNKEACKNLIIFIGDGMGPEHIKAGELVYDTTYDFTNWDHSYSNTCSYYAFADDNSEITDSAAGGTAIATGEVTVNGFVGKDKYGNDLATILDYAKAMGKSTGIVTTDSITGATPADFSGHTLSRSFTDEIIDTQLKSNVDLFIGQYNDAVELRKNDIKKHGYTHYPSIDSIEDINSHRKVWAQFDFEESGGQTSLKKASEVAINYLSQNDNGYVLMIEQAHIDKYSHNHDFENMVKVMNSLNDTIESVKNNNDTGIIITADHETGGLSVSKENIYLTSYNNVYYHYLTTSHTPKEVLVYTYGFEVDFEKFSEFNQSTLVKNSDIFDIELFAITNQK